MDDILIFHCPVHGLECGLYCEEAEKPENLREWKHYRLGFIRDASEAEVLDTLPPKEPEVVSKKSKSK